ncbi:hypothetical protein Lupro_11905 [Lutibacter profundi]|uniref:Type I restriction modification DNA specificity domain-containing protein n=2 Tax=Lutibacter profundi TaxID=1622118 RepID=A0A0X8G8A9_9FLAO|nr:hypothetical protein Lupro_11905 [Lutibacter profundi]
MNDKLNKNIPQLRFPEFDGEWDIKTLDQITTRIGDGIHSTPEYNDNGNYYFINGNNLVDGKIEIFETTKKVEESEAIKHNRELSDRTILLSINGTIGNLAFYTNEKVMLGKSAAYLNIRNEVDKEFIYNSLKISKTQNFFFSELTGSTIKNLSLKTIRETKIPIPTPAEQTRIATFLSAVDKRINLLQKKKAQLEQYKKGVMHKLFSQTIRFKYDNGNNFPDWEEKMLGEVGIFISGIGFANIEQGGQTGIPFLKVSDMNLVGNNKKITVANNYVNIEQIERLKYKPILEDSIIFAKVGAAIFLERKRIASNFLIDNNMMSYTPKGEIKFFKHLFDTLRLSKFAQVGALPSYNASDLKTIKIRLPSKPEQQKIAKFLSSIDKSIENVGKQIEASQEWKKGLLQKMFV